LSLHNLDGFLEHLVLILHAHILGGRLRPSSPQMSPHWTRSSAPPPAFPQKRLPPSLLLKGRDRSRRENARHTMVAFRVWGPQGWSFFLLLEGACARVWWSRSGENGAWRKILPIKFLISYLKSTVRS
jgi:hypothetical protein